MTLNQAPMSLADLQPAFPTQNKWEDLETMFTECSGFFGELAVYPQQANVLEKDALPEEKKELQRILRNIRADCEKYLADLRNIRAQHCDANGQPRTGLVLDTHAGEHLFEYLGIATAYRSWSENFQGLMLSPVEDFTAIQQIIVNRTNGTQPS